MSPMAGLPVVVPPRLALHTMPQEVLEANTVLESEAPGKNDPVPKAIPVWPPPRKLPTAVDESTVWLVS